MTEWRQRRGEAHMRAFPLTLALFSSPLLHTRPPSPPPPQQRGTPKPALYCVWGDDEE